MASLLPTGKSYERLGNFPLDSSSIKSTLEEAIDYASNNPTAYHGQIIFIVDARTQDEITSNVEIYGKLMYIDNDNTLQEIGANAEGNIIISRGSLDLTGTIRILPDEDSGGVMINFNPITGDLELTGATLSYNDATGDLGISGATLNYNSVTGDLEIS